MSDRRLCLKRLCDRPAIFGKFVPVELANADQFNRSKNGIARAEPFSTDMIGLKIGMQAALSAEASAHEQKRLNVASMFPIAQVLNPPVPIVCCADLDRPTVFTASEIGKTPQATRRTVENHIGWRRTHAAASCGENVLGTGLPCSCANRTRPSIRHFGMEPEAFQLDTVVGASSSAFATATVPPSVLMNSVTVCISHSLRYP